MTTSDVPSQPESTATPAVPASIRATRQALAQATSDYLAVPDAALERPWSWHGGELDVRHGVYWGGAAIEAATAEIDVALAGQPPSGLGARIIATATTARWALQGRLASLDDAILDRIAKADEWSVRQVVGHTIDGQRSYGWVTDWRLSLPAGTGPIKMPPEVEARAEVALPGEDADGLGTLAELRARMDACLDEWGLRLGSTPDELLSKSALWSGIPVDIAFRFARWSQHIAEHTVQLDKTLDWLGYQPTEVARIVRDLHSAWGRLESRLFPAASTSPAVDEILARVSETLVAEARSTRAAAEA